MANENKTKYAILGVLNIQSGSGYDIKKFCDRSINHFWSENYGHIYPVLKQMENDGWVIKTTENLPGKPKRNLYSVTDAGRDALREWLLTPAELTKPRYEVLLKMFFSDELPVETTLIRIIELKTFFEEMLQEFEQIETDCKDVMNEKGPEGEHLFYRFSTLRYGILNTKANIAWCTEVIEHLEKHQKRSMTK